MHTPTAITFIDGSLPGIDMLNAGLPVNSTWFVLEANEENHEQ